MLASATGLLVVSIVLLHRVWVYGIQSIQIGGWQAPFGITLVADLFSAIMIVMTGLIAFSIAIYSLVGIDDRQEAFGYYPLVSVLLMGVCGAFLTGDMFNLYVWFEVMLIASFVLMALGGKRIQIEGALKYVAINLLSSAIFLAAVGLLYGATGTLNMADLAFKMKNGFSSPVIHALSVLFLVTFGVKAAIFPLFFWLPASYPTPPVVISALFAGLLTKVGVYALIRVFTLIFTQEPATYSIILVLASLTMLTGVLGAVAQMDFRRLLSFHIISQIGYMLMGLGLYTVAGIAGAIFYIIHHIIVKTNLFLIAGLIHKMSNSFDLKKLGSLYRISPLISILFLIPAMSLAGMPPLSGFFSKFILIKEAVRTEQYIMAGIALMVSLLTLFSMTKVWSEAFWKNSDSSLTIRELAPREKFYMLFPIIFLATMTLLISAGAGFFYNLSLQAAKQLLNPEEYIRAVLGPIL